LIHIPSALCNDDTDRHDDRMKWYKLTGIGASRAVEFRNSLLSSLLS
jgi:hypothetical protein